MFSVTQGFSRSSRSPVFRQIVPWNQQRYKSSISAAFRDPTSPFYIAPGTTGPASPDSPPSLDARPITTATTPATKDHAGLVQDAREKLRKAGMDPASFWEQRIVWGDHDSFQHVNNVRYLRFFESARILWMMSLGEELGGPQKAEDMMRGQGISLILKSIQVKYRRPVTFPDTLLIGYRPVPPPSPDPDPATFKVAASAYSLAQQAFVAHSEEELVWYDYAALKKADPGEDVRSVVWRRMDAHKRS
ncbi:hypothetical protein AX16_004317 [Volvariella volvacea WC 439]|nr:hypothetical protein AX16_004317 [Volvariella volvacea WC 439]